MSFSTVNTLKLIETYKSGISNKAFNIHEPYNLIQAQKGIDFLSDLLGDSPGSEIKFQNYQQMMYFINYTEYLEKINKLPSKDAEEDELKDHIVEFRNISKSYLGDSIPERVNNAIVFYDDLVDLFNEWKGREDIIKIPYNQQIEAQKKIQPYLNMAKSQPMESQQMLYGFLQKLGYPQAIFDQDKKKNDMEIVRLLNEIREKHADKLQFIDNVYFVANTIDLTVDETYALWQMDAWNQNDLQDKYTFSTDEVEKGVKSIVENKEDPLKKKAEEAKQKALEEENKKNEEEKKRAEEEAAKDPLAEEKKEIEKLVNQARGLQNVVNELPNLSQPPTVQDYVDLKDQASRHLQENNKALSMINNTLSTI